MTKSEPRGLPGADFDHRTPEWSDHPWETWAKLRAEDSLAYSQNYGGYYVASRYDDVCAMARNPAVFSSYPQVTIPDLPVPPFPPINYDPPANRSYRQIVNPFFSPAMVAQQEWWIRELAERRVRSLLELDRMDIPKDLGIPLTREVILRLMGITEVPDAVNGWSDDLIQQSPNAAKAGELLVGFLAGELQKRRETPGGDIISGLVDAPFEDRVLNDGEILQTALLILLAGLETTNSAISGSVWYLVEHPELQRQLLEADSTTWRLAMDEFVRWTSPAAANSRYVRGDAVVHGCPVHDGDRALLVWGSANRDEREFPHPDEIILDRRPNRHVGFGMGPHRCVGSHLAKLVMQVTFESLLPELHQWRLEGPDAVGWAGAETRGIDTLVLVRK